MSDAASPAPAAPARRDRGRTPSAAVERELLSAAEAVLMRDGPRGVTVRSVAAQARIAPMGLYNRLGGKDGLVDALLIRGFDRLRTALEAAHGRDALARLRSCSMRYRDFALENPHFYAIMFEGAIAHEHLSSRVGEHARASFGVLVRSVELAAAAGLITAPDPLETAQQIWSAVHGATALELKGLVLTADPAATYCAFLDTIIRGLARGAPAQPPEPG